MRKITVSEILTYDTCPQMWAWRYHKGLASSTSTALRIGSAVHEWFAQRLMGVQYPEPVAKRRDLYPEDQATAEVVDQVLEHWRPGPWEHVEQVEQALEYELWAGPGGAIALGKPDAVVWWQSKIWHVQHKVIAATMPVATYADSIAKSLHEGLYCAMLEQLGAVGGTMLNVVRKVAKSTAEARPKSALHIEFLPITRDMREGAVQDIKVRALEIMELEGRVDSPLTRVYRKRSECHGKFGNSRCPYYGLCWEGASEDTWPKQDPLARYGEQQG